MKKTTPCKSRKKPKQRISKRRKSKDAFDKMGRAIKPLKKMHKKGKVIYEKAKPHIKKAGEKISAGTQRLKVSVSNWFAKYKRSRGHKYRSKSEEL